MPTAIITKAWDDLRTGNYDEEGAVEELLTGVLTDAAGTTLAQVLSATEKATIVERYRAMAGDEIRRRAGRDFAFHQDVEVYVNGSGTPYLDLAQYGFWPLYEVSQMLVEDTGQAIDTLIVEPSGLIHFANEWQFPKGNRNIRLTISWGFSDTVAGVRPVPQDVKDAQSMLAAANILEYIQATKNVDGLGGISIIQYGEMSIRQYQRGRFSPTIDAWKERAYATCNFYRGVNFHYLVPANVLEYGEKIQEAR